MGFFMTKEDVNRNYEEAKKVIFMLEKLCKEQMDTYNNHVERIQALSFLYQRIDLLRKVELDMILDRNRLDENEQDLDILP